MNLRIVLLLIGLAACAEPVVSGIEVCDQRDNDGDGAVDEGFDFDADGYLACSADPALLDCNDRDARVFPGAVEQCDGRDDDCDGVVPPEEQDLDMDGDLVCAGDCDDLDAFRNLADRDGDFVTSCDAVPDCDDFDADVNPGEIESCDGRDTDCVGGVPEDEVDADGDGQSVCGGDCDDTDATQNNLDIDGDQFVSCAPDDDCDDGDPTINPGRPEGCDGADNDCDGIVPDWESDTDGDGGRICEGDCDDANPARYRGNPEICDELDNDCDGVVPAFEYDTDADGERPAPCAADCDDADATVSSNDWDGDGVSPCDTVPDCDDLDGAVYPGAVGLCNGVDDNCDGGPDMTGDVDVDGDGHPSCEDLDCDDGDPATYAGAVELCDGVDNACAGTVPTDEVDDDGDGWTECGASAGRPMIDCDDANADAHPGLEEACADGVDSDCDGSDDTWSLYVDADADGVGGASALAQSCAEVRVGATFGVDYDSDGVPDVYWSVYSEDCDDFDATASPDQTEICGEHVDNDCDGEVDEDDCI